MTDPELSGSHIPPLEEVSAAYTDILDYNKKRTGLGVAMANFIKGAIETASLDILDENDDVIEPTNRGMGSEPVDSNRLSDNIRQRIAEGEMEADLQDLFHADTFERIGVKVSPLGMRVENTEGFGASNWELKPYIENTELFVDFLKGLNREEVQEKTENYQLMGDVLASLNTAVAAGFGRMPEGVTEEEMTAAKTYGEDALRTFIAIEPEYERLGLDEPVIYKQALQEERPQYLNDEWKLRYNAERYVSGYKHLTESVKYWGRNVLPEYLKVGRELEPHEQFGYFDAMHDKLISNVDYIASMQLDDRTREFGKEIAAAKIQSLEMTLKGFDDPEAWYNSPENKKLAEDQLARLRQIVEA